MASVKIPNTWVHFPRANVWYLKFILLLLLLFLLFLYAVADILFVLSFFSGWCFFHSPFKSHFYRIFWHFTVNDFFDIHWNVGNELQYMQLLWLPLFKLVPLLVPLLAVWSAINRRWRYLMKDSFQLRTSVTVKFTGWTEEDRIYTWRSVV